MIVGGRSEDPHVRQVLEGSAGRVIHVPAQPHTRMPEILCQADMVVLPQKATLYTRAQVPGKVYEAMAMAKAIVATAVSDLPLILGDAGLVVEPGNRSALTEAVRQLIDDPGLCQEMGRRARERAVAHYSWDAMESTLRDIFGRFQ